MILSALQIVFLSVLGLFCIGLYGLLVTRNLIKVVIVLQLMVKSAVVALVLAGKASGEVNLGQSLAVTVIVADTIVAVIALALAVQVQRHCGTLDLQALSRLHG